MKKYLLILFVLITACSKEDITEEFLLQSLKGDTTEQIDNTETTQEETNPDFDNDGIPDEEDEDDDNDGVLDENDAFPNDPTESVDTDGDGIGDNTDIDANGNGINDDYEIKFNSNISEYSYINHESNSGYYSHHSSKEINDIISEPYHGIYVAVGVTYFDFNNDGNVDYLLQRVKDGKFFFILNMGGELIHVELMKGGEAYYNKGARKIITSDLNRDGYVDIIVSAADDNVVEQRGLFILKGSPDGFEEIVISQGESEFFHSVATGDINNDGYPDIMIGGRNFFYSFKEDFSFEKISVPTCWSCGMEYERAITHELLDINNDGYSDIIVGYSNKTWDVSGEEYWNSTAIYYGINGYPYFEEEYVLPSIYENANVTYDVSVIDFDGDGDLDIFANTNNFADETSRNYMIQYYENNGDGTFQNKTEDIFDNNSNVNHNYYQIDWIKVFDIDNDGKLDLLVESQNWRVNLDVDWGWFEPNFNGYKLNSDNKFERFYFDN